jgi:hypothetical protein
LESVSLREHISDDLIVLLTSFVNDKVKIEFAVKEFNKILQRQA